MITSFEIQYNDYDSILARLDEGYVISIALRNKTLLLRKDFGEYVFEMISRFGERRKGDLTNTELGHCFAYLNFEKFLSTVKQNIQNHIETLSLSRAKKERKKRQKRIVDETKLLKQIKKDSFIPKEYINFSVKEFKNRRNYSNPEIQLRDFVVKFFEQFYLVHEFNHSSMNVRPDLAFVDNDNLCFIELKSKKDNLLKLREQIKGYQLLADRIYLFLDIKHKKNFEKKFQDIDNCYVYFFSEDTAELYLEPQNPPTPEINNLCDLLWSVELSRFVSTKHKDKNIEDKLRLFKKDYKDNLKQKVLEILRLRFIKKNEKDLNEDIENFL